MYDRQKTKIIATLGDPKLKRLNKKTGKLKVVSTYENGLYDFNQKVLKKPSLKDIVHLFFKHDVDVIRINLAHIRIEDLPAKFREIKEAILDAEKRWGRTIGVLADLPGPKIRFNKSDWLIPRNILRVSFDEIKDEVTLAPKRDNPRANKAPLESRAQINLDEKAFAVEARAAVDEMLEAVRARLKEINKLKEIGGGSDQKLLAFIGDNDCTLEVVNIEGREIICKVVSVRDESRVAGGSKGFTIRGIPKSISAFTPQDQAKLSALLRLDFENSATDTPSDRILSHIGISFCQSRDDARKVLQHVVECLKPLLRLPGDKLGDYLVEAPLLIAKIETEEGVKNLNEILDIADGAMIARGDLAVEIETTDVPRKSKEIINKCNLRGKPVIMATQMLGSMKETIECARPEATDVFDAVVDNVDALMLSGETSSGKYPAHAIEKMRALAKSAESYINDKASEGAVFVDDTLIQKHFRQLEQIRNRVERWQDRWIKIAQEYSEQSAEEEITHEESLFVDELVRLKNQRLRRQHATDRITHAACLMSIDAGADPRYAQCAAIVAPTTSGRTARMLARFRPRVWILAQPHNKLTARKLALDRGVIAIDILPVQKGEKEVDRLIKESREAFERRYNDLIGMNKDATIIFTCGSPLGEVGTTNMIHRWDIKRRS